MSPQALYSASVLGTTVSEVNDMSKMLICAPLFLILALLSGCEVTVEEPLELEHLQMPGMEGLDLPFSAAVRVGNTLYLSGNLGNLPGTLQLADGGIQGETRQTMDNIAAVLTQFGSSLQQVAKCTVFMADMSEWAEMNAVYATYFDKPPARSALGANGLALDARVEIECIAVVD